jgi:hypothetical protein
MRLGDVLFVDDLPHAITDIEWDEGAQLVHVDLSGFESGVAGPWTFGMDDQVDVTRPFTRHAETGDHDL